MCIRQTEHSKEFQLCLEELKKNHNLIKETIQDASKTSLMEYWNVNQVSENRLLQWIQIAADCSASSSLTYAQIYDMLCGIFTIEP